MRAWRLIRWGRRCYYRIGGVQVCGMESWVNPPSDHKNWLGHPWTRRWSAVPLWLWAAGAVAVALDVAGLILAWTR